MIININKPRLTLAAALFAGASLWIAATPAVAQKKSMVTDSAPAHPIESPQVGSIVQSDNAIVEIERKKLRTELRARQLERDKRDFDRWSRWTFAVCIGCNPLPSNARAVYTYPLRVLEGIPAYVDDARDRRTRTMRG